MRHLFLCGALALLLGASACTPALPPAARTALGDRPLQVTGVPHLPQQEDYCGPTSLAMLLAWSGVDRSPAALVPSVYSPEPGGSLQLALIGGARRAGRVAYEIHGWKTLTAALAAGQPVLVLENLGLSWWPRWHYAVVTGIDPVAGTVRQHSGRAAPELRPLGQMEQTWRRSGYWGLLVLPVATLPAELDCVATLQGLAGYERVGGATQTLPGYGKVTERWPQCTSGWLALGNALYTAGHLEPAAAAFDRACRPELEDVSACNNLASVRGEQGQLQQAREAIERALRLDGAHPAVRETLREIEAAERKRGTGPDYLR